MAKGKKVGSISAKYRDKLKTAWASRYPLRYVDAQGRARAAPVVARWLRASILTLAATDLPSRSLTPVEGSGKSIILVGLARSWKPRAV